ncbi:Uncharacterized protein SCF082_LOCUS13524, partial [Durusdinium trenchii]
VPAVQLVETAKAILADDAALGIQRNDKVLKRIAKGGPTHAARQAFAAFDSVNLRAPMRVSRDSIGQRDDYPWIRPQDFAFCLQREKRLDLLLPAADLQTSRLILQEYWRRFKNQYDDHGIFQELTPQELQLTVPIKIHGDEGKKKSPIMLMSWQPVLGSGTSRSITLPAAVQKEAMNMNFLGHCETTRFLSFAALKETYWDNPGVLQKAMTLIAEDLLAFMRKGIPLEDSNLPLRVAVVSIKGDWPWLIEAGALTRHFRRAPKKGESAMVGEGICHLCLAGCDGYPMHEVGDAAKFLATMGSAASLCPWNTLAPWVDLLPASPSFHPYMFRPDLWHNFHLGQGRYWLSSAFVVLLPLFGDGGVEVRFQRMTASWREYCSRKKIRLLAFRLQYFVIC